MAPTGYRVREGDMVYIDVGGRYMGYHSDCSRQRVCGEPTAEQRRFMEAQIRIVEEVTRAARPGAVIGDLAKIGIALAQEAGYEQYLYFRGHGIGAAVQDLPAFAPGNPAALQENTISAAGGRCWWRASAAAPIPAAATSHRAGRSGRSSSGRWAWLRPSAWGA
jgi:Xaa-Pro aminopeptidase